MILSQLPKLHSKTWGIIEADLTRVLDPLRRGKQAGRFDTTNLSADDILNHGRMVVVDARPAG